MKQRIKIIFALVLGVSILILITIYVSRDTSTTEPAPQPRLEVIKTEVIPEQPRSVEKTEQADEQDGIDIVSSVPEPESEIPTGSYRVEYFNKENLDKPLGTETVDYIGLKSRSHDFKFDEPIPGDQFAGKWTGNIEVLQEGIWSFNINLPSYNLVTPTVQRTEYPSELRLLVDDVEVYFDKKSSVVQHKLTPGIHKIVAEFVSQIENFEFAVTVSLSEKVFDTNEVTNALAYMQKETGDDINVWAASAYESTNLDSSVEVTVTNTTKPTILVLTSYENIIWDMKSIPDNVFAIVVNSYEIGSAVNLNGNNIPVFKIINADFEVLTDVYPSCEGYVEFGFKCDELYAFSNFENQILEITGKPLTGITAVYDTDSVTMPELEVTEILQKEINAVIQTFLDQIE